MESVLNSVVVTAIFIVTNFCVGLFLIHKSGKPYGAVKIIVHITLFVLILAGFIASFYKLQGISLPKLLSTLSLYLMGLTLITNLVTGAVLLVSHTVNQQLASVHKTSTFVMIGSVIACIIFLVAAV
jgi:hypothetical protein